MQVIKVLNTSVVLAQSMSGEEVILMGKGIGFRKAIGDTIDLADDDKVYILSDKRINRDIIRLASETDAEMFTITKEVIDFAITSFNMKLMDSIYLSLTDHLVFAVKSVINGTQLHGVYSNEIKLFYPHEYSVGCYALEVIKKVLGIELPASEVAKISFHFINAQTDQNENKERDQILQIIKDVKSIVMYRFKVIYNEDGIAYTRFITHLQTLAQRLIHNQQLKDDNSMFILDNIKQSIHAEMCCVEVIAEFINNTMNLIMTDYEMVYLGIHISRVLSENQYDNDKGINH